MLFQKISRLKPLFIKKKRFSTKKSISDSQVFLSLLKRRETRAALCVDAEVYSLPFQNILFKMTSKRELEC